MLERRLPTPMNRIVTYLRGHPLWRWLLRAVRQSGDERTTIVQALKSALAAVIAWLIAAKVFQLPQPFLAPYSAVFLIESTVYRSVRSATQQVGAVLAGVLLAGAVAWALPWQTVGIALVVFLGFGIGRWHRFGPSGVWVGVTALLLLSYGTASDAAVLAERVLETLLGAGIGLLVNTFLLPPVYVRDPADATRSVSRELAAILEELADALREEGPLTEPDAWVSRARNGERRVRLAEAATGWGSESMRFNPRPAARRASTSNAHARSVLVAVRSAWPYIQELVRALQAAIERPEEFSYPDPQSRECLSALLDASAAGIRARMHGSNIDLRKLAEQGETALSELERRVESTPGDALAMTAGLSSMMLPARQAFRLVVGSD